MCKRNKHESFHHYSNIRVAWAEVKKKKSHSHDMVLVEWLSHNGKKEKEKYVCWNIFQPSKQDKTPLT